MCRGVDLYVHLSSGVPALLFLLAVGFFNSIMFPTIFTLAIEDLEKASSQGSGLLCTAIGGAFIPPAVGALVDGASFEVAFLLPHDLLRTSRGSQAGWCLIRPTERQERHDSLTLSLTFEQNATF